MFFVQRVIYGCLLFWLSLSTVALAQPAGRASTEAGDILRGQGEFLRGAGWYNLRTAQANAINVDTTIRWKQDLRKIQSERMYLETQKGIQKKQNVEELRRQIAQREKELRSNPSSNDVQSGAALNALVYDLTDPDITPSQWKSVSPIALPPGTSVKELIFSFTPHSVSTQASAALSRGVIALSRLDIKDKWPLLLKKDEMKNERKAYEDAYLRVRDKIIRGDYAVDEILALDGALDSLKSRIETEIPLERYYRTEAKAFVEDLRNATRMFDARSVEYAREILIDTKDHDATTVEELVAFMLKYRLQFANSDRSPTARELYGHIYDKLRQQMQVMNVKPFFDPIPDPIPDDKWVRLFNGKNLAGWKVESGDPKRWKIEEGMLRTEGATPITYLLTDRDYSDFKLRLEFSVDDVDARSGIALRGQPNEHIIGAKGKGADVIRHPVLLLTQASNETPTGTLNWMGVDRNIPEKKPDRLLPDRWNRLEIQMRGASLRATLNGSPLMSADVPANARLTDGTQAGLARAKGRIGLQSNRGSVRFRNIEIMELSSSK